DNNGLEDGTHDGFYDYSDHLPERNWTTPGLYRGYAMSNNWDWIYAGYFLIEEATTFDTMIGYFDPTNGFDPDAAVNTADHMRLRELDGFTGGRLLERPSLSEVFGEAGRSVAVASSCSTGACFLQNHRSCGVTYNSGFATPQEHARAIARRFGPIPPDARPNTGRNDYATAVLTDYLLGELRPDLAILWLSDPDHTQHDFPLGSAESAEAIRQVDACVGNALRALADLRLEDDTDVLVASDHGFISDRPPGLQLARDMVAAGVKEGPDSTDVRVVGCGVYLDPGRGRGLEHIVRFLQQHESVGAIFTGREAPGTLSTSLIGCEHDRSPDVLFARTWTSASNAFGVTGLSPGDGTASHGGTSRQEMRALLIAAGPSFRGPLQSALPSGNIDILPTVLAIHGLDVDPAPGGRVLGEAMTDPPEGSAPAASKAIH
ncbi:hypothetical protein LCGC14_2713610, partial [marine sediment metagenome]